MDDEDVKPRPQHALGDDLSRLSVRELEALRAALLEEAERVAREIEAKAATRSAADSIFKPAG